MDRAKHRLGLESSAVKLNFFENLIRFRERKKFKRSNLILGWVLQYPTQLDLKIKLH